jgi:hypothetical protein
MKVLSKSTARGSICKSTRRLSSLLPQNCEYPLTEAELVLASVLIWSRPQPKTRGLVYDCLRPVFRKDEESAWTIVATEAASSRDSFDSISVNKETRRNSISSVRSFAFINDLLTAPVYKRLALSALQPAKPSQRSHKTLPSPSVEATSNEQTPDDKSQTASVHKSCISTSNRQRRATATTNRLETADVDPVQLAVDVASASGTFSSSVIADLNEIRLSRWLPIRAIVSREHLTAEEQSSIDAELLNAAADNSLVGIAEALDAGADINAVDAPGSYQTALQIATNTSGGCSVVNFLVHYRNINLHVRDRQGGNLLHSAVQMECEACVQSLLEVGLSMTAKDENGMSAFNWATDNCLTTGPLLTMLRHATKAWVDTSHVTALDPRALQKLCCQKPLRREHALVLVRFEWPLTKYLSTTSPEFCRILRKEGWLLKEMIKQPKTMTQIRAKGPTWETWDKVLRVATSWRGANPEIVIQLLRAGIDFRHLTYLIFEFAEKKRDLPIMEFLAQHTDPGVSFEKVISGGATRDGRFRLQECSVMLFGLMVGPTRSTDVVMKVPPCASEYLLLTNSGFLWSTACSPKS